MISFDDASCLFADWIVVFEIDHDVLLRSVIREGPEAGKNTIGSAVDPGHVNSKLGESSATATSTHVRQVVADVAR